MAVADAFVDRGGALQRRSQSSNTLDAAPGALPHEPNGRAERLGVGVARTSLDVLRGRNGRLLTVVRDSLLQAVYHQARAAAGAAWLGGRRVGASGLGARATEARPDQGRTIAALRPRSLHVAARAVVACRYALREEGAEFCPLTADEGRFFSTGSSAAYRGAHPAGQCWSSSRPGAGQLSTMDRRCAAARVFLSLQASLATDAHSRRRHRVACVRARVAVRRPRAALVFPRVHALLPAPAAQATAHGAVRRGSSAVHRGARLLRVFEFADLPRFPDHRVYEHQRVHVQPSVFVLSAHCTYVLSCFFPVCLICFPLFCSVWHCFRAFACAWLTRGLCSEHEVGGVPSHRAHHLLSRGDPIRVLCCCLMPARRARRGAHLAHRSVAAGGGRRVLLCHHGNHQVHTVRKPPSHPPLSSRHLIACPPACLCSRTSTCRRWKPRRSGGGSWWSASASCTASSASSSRPSTSPCWNPTRRRA